MTSAIAPSGCTTMSGANDSATELAHDREPEHDRADDPGRPREQTPQLCAGEAAGAAEPLSLSTLVTPRCWYCAPNDMKTAPSRASGMPIRRPGFWNTPTSVSPTSSQLVRRPHHVSTLVADAAR